MSQKEQLETKLIGNGLNAQSPKQEQEGVENITAILGTNLREALKGDLMELLTEHPKLGSQELTDRTNGIIERNLEKLGPVMVSEAAVLSRSRELGTSVSKRLYESISRSDRAHDRDRELRDREAADTRIPTSHPYER